MLETGDPKLSELAFFAEGCENSNRPVRIIKMIEAYKVFKELINYYAVVQLMRHMEANSIKNLGDLQKNLPSLKQPADWLNAGGQLIKESSIRKLISDIHRNKVKSWNDIHAFYLTEGARYDEDKMLHSLSIYKLVIDGDATKLKEESLRMMFTQALSTRQWMSEGIKKSREKDYENPFRLMVYESEEEMNKVVGPFNKNSFINLEIEQHQQFRRKVNGLLKLKTHEPRSLTGNFIKNKTIRYCQINSERKNTWSYFLIFISSLLFVPIE